MHSFGLVLAKFPKSWNVAQQFAQLLRFFLCDNNSTCCLLKGLTQRLAFRLYPISKFLKHEGKLAMHFWGVWVRPALFAWDLFSNQIVPHGKPRRHPGLEFEKYHDALCSKNFENAEETKRNASEGFQGLSKWIKFRNVLLWFVFVRDVFFKPGSAKQHVLWSCLGV